MGRRGRLPVTEALASEILSLPMGPHLSLVDLARVAEVAAEMPSRAGGRLTASWPAASQMICLIGSAPSTPTSFWSSPP